MWQEDVRPSAATAAADFPKWQRDQVTETLGGIETGEDARLRRSPVSRFTRFVRSNGSAPEPSSTVAVPSAERAGTSARARLRSLAHYGADVACWAVAIPVIKFIHYAGVRSVNLWPTVTLVGLAVVSQGLIGLTLHLYRGRYRFGSLEEMVALTTTVLFTSAALTLYSTLQSDLLVRRTVPFLSAMFALNLMVAGRTFRRMWLRRRVRHVDDRRLLVVGAGEASSAIIKVLLDAPPGSYRPVALLDDDPAKKFLRIQGVKVEGALADLVQAARRCDADAVLYAIPSQSSEHIRYVAELAREADLPLFMLPRVADMFTRPMASDIRPVSEDDLLGRDTADIDVEAVADYVSGRRVLVTGAGGSIGSELCRQLAQLGPEKLIMLDRDESALAAVQLSIEGRTRLDSELLVLADIRDSVRMHEVFQHHRPHVVFHAAALKHLAMLEQAPDEAWKTNVFGTKNVLRAAASSGVERFVNISTDKAADPVSVLGMSKRITERLTAGMAFEAEGTFVSVRFGNVLGSRGSVLTIFSAQVEAHEPITVTHPDVTRYFMTVQEAVRLTLYAGAIGSRGEVLVLDMGEPVRILDVAKRFSRQATPPLPIVFTGLRDGEKLHEVLWGPDEVDDRRVHPLVSHVPAPALSVEMVAATYSLPGASLTERLERLVAPPTPSRVD